MDTLELIRGRRTVHKYLDQPIAPEIIERALEAARWAPCHKLTWPWRFRVVGRQTREALCAAALKVRAQKCEVSASAEAALRQKLITPALIVATQRRCEDPHRAKEDYAAVACALQNAMLSLHADGLGSKWSTGALTRAPFAHELLGVTPDEEVVGFLWLGHPAAIPSIPRPSLAERVTYLP